jgi:hypothetical protein
MAWTKSLVAVFSRVGRDAKSCVSTKQKKRHHLPLLVMVPTRFHFFVGQKTSEGGKGR